MAEFFKIERTNPLNDIKQVVLNGGFFSSETDISGTLLSGIGEISIDVSSPKSFFRYKINEIGQWAFYIDQNSDFFKKYLIDSNFSIILKSLSNPKNFAGITYTIEPSSIFLDNISITSREIDGKNVGGLGNITNEGVCELWSDYSATVLTSSLSRVYYSNSEISIEESPDSDVYWRKAIDEAKLNGGGRIKLTDTNREFGVGPIIYNSSGIYTNSYNYVEDKFIEQFLGSSDSQNYICFIGCDCSTIIDRFQLGVNYSNTLDKRIEVELICSDVMFRDCYLNNIVFKLSQNSKINFKNCRLTNCLIYCEDGSNCTLYLSKSSIQFSQVTDISTVELYSSGVNQVNFVGADEAVFRTVGFNYSFLEENDPDPFLMENEIDSKVVILENCSIIGDDSSFKLNCDNGTLKKCFTNGKKLLVSFFASKSLEFYDSAFGGDHSITVHRWNNCSFAVSNCSFENPISLTSDEPDEFTDVVSIHSTFFGKSATDDGSDDFKSFVNSIIVEVDDSRDGVIEAVTGTDGIDSGSFKIYTKLTKINKFYFNNEVSPYNHLNGALKCLKYPVSVSGISYYELLVRYESNVDAITKYYNHEDIFGEVRSESLPKSGCEEKEALNNIGGTITLSYFDTTVGINEFENKIKLHQSPITVNEFNDVPDPSIYSIYWTKGGADVPSSLSDGRSYYIYSINRDDDGKEIVCTCDDGTTIVQNSVTIAIEETPIVRYKNASYKAWTNQYFVLDTAVETSLGENFPPCDVTWFKQNDGVMTEKINVIGTYYDQVTESVKASLVINPVEKSDEASYYCELYYKPERFEMGRTITGINPSGKKVPVPVTVKYNIIINNKETTNGLVTLRSGDMFTFTSALIQGEAPWFEWQKCIDIDNGVWEVIYGPTKSSMDYSRFVYDLDDVGTFYRFHAFNYNIDDDRNSGIATEDYSDPTVRLVVLPKVRTGEEIDSNITVFKIPFKMLEDSNISTDMNYRVFDKLDNIDPNRYADDLNYYPTLHRRPESELWKYSGAPINDYVRNYNIYEFPSDVDIDKMNLSFGIASERVVLENKTTKTGGYLYLLELDRLNDLIEFKINKPKSRINILDAYYSQPSDDTVYFNELGSKIFVRNGYIAVVDSSASFVQDSNYYEFEIFTNPKIYQIDGKITWDIKYDMMFEEFPVFKILDLDGNVVNDGTISYIKNEKIIRFKMDYEYPFLSERTYKMLIVGKKYLSLTNDLRVETFDCPQLNKHSDSNYITWEIEHSQQFSGVPIIQIIDRNGNVVNRKPLLSYDKYLRTFTVYFETEETFIEAETYQAVILGKRIEMASNDEVISETFENPTLYTFDGKVKWTVNFGSEFDVPPYFEIYSYNTTLKNFTENISNMKISSDKLEITFDLDEMIPSGSIAVSIIASNVAEVTEKADIEKTNVGRVLLFKYDQNTEMISLEKVIKSPNEAEEGHFGECVEFDDYGNILISAPGEVCEQEIGYIEKNYDIIPSYSKDKSLKFSTRGKVYVYSLEELLSTGMFERTTPKQVLCNQSLFKSVNYSLGTWGDMKNLYRIQSLYVVKDIATNGNKVNEGFSDISSYLEYYNFNWTYDFMYKKFFPTPYTDEDFKRGNSRSEYFQIEYRQLYYTMNCDERFGTSLSYNNGTVIIGSPYYNNNRGMVEVWKYNKVLDRYDYKSNLKNPAGANSTETLFGINVETGDNYFLATFRQNSFKQSVLLARLMDSGRVAPDTILINPGTGQSNSRQFGNSMDSYGDTFVIASPNDGKIYRYQYKTNDEGEFIVETIQKINLQKFGIISMSRDNIVVTKNKILAAYTSYGTASGTMKDSNGDNLISSGSGAVLQLTLTGGEFRI